VQDKVPYLSGWKEPFTDDEADVHVGASEFVTIGPPVGAAVVGTGVGGVVVGTGVGGIVVGTGVVGFGEGAGVGGFEGGLVGGPHASALKHSSKGI